MKRLPIRLASLAQGKPNPWEVRPPKRSDLFRNSGQALLVILLIMAVALTIGLAITSRTVTDVEISSQTEEAARAFSAAEAGIEEALVGIGTTTFGGGFGEGVSYTTKRDLLGASSQFLFPEATRADEVRTLWLAEYPDTQSYMADSLILYWGNYDSGERPALEATIYFKIGSDYKVIRYTLDSESRDPDNGFCRPGDGSPRCDGVLEFIKNGSFPIGGKTARNKTTLDLLPASGGTLLFVRLRLLYANEATQVVGAEAVVGSLPSQGVKIESTGLAGTSTRKVEVVRMHPAPPGIFDFLLYSGGDLSK